MGKLVRLKGWTSIDINRSNLYASGYLATFVDINGEQHNMTSSASSSNMRQPFYFSSFGTPQTAPSSSGFYPFVHASPLTDIPYSTTSLGTQVGNCTVTWAKNAKADGVIANITVVGSADATIGSFIFTNNLAYGSATAETATFAYILDSPIALSSENNYTANLTIAISFGE